MRRDDSVGFLFYFYLTCSCFVMGLIYYLSSRPAVESQAQSDVILMFLVDAIKINPTDEGLELMSMVLRKSAHFGIYAVLGGFLVLAASRYYLNVWATVNMWTPLRKLFVPWTVAVLYAISDEFHQSFVFGRSGELRDVLIDGAGALLGILLLNWYFVCHHREE